MIVEIEAHTDIAMVGLWDPDLPHCSFDYKEWKEMVKRGSQEGKLLYVDTDGDGSYRTCVTTTDKELARFDLSHYKLAEGKFFLTSTKGKITIGGAEDYRSSEPQITDERSSFKVSPGTYLVEPYVMIEEEKFFHDVLIQEVGIDDVEYYESRPSGCSWSFYLLILSIVGGYYISWWLVPLAIVLGIIMMRFCGRRNDNDERYTRVKRESEKIEKRFPELLFHFTKVESNEISKGHFTLNDILAR